MPKTAKAYIYSVIVAGGCILVASLANWSSPDLQSHISCRAHVKQATDRIEQLPA